VYIHLMNKYIITDRRTGLGDTLLNLAACWYLGKRYHRDVILDWRRLPYTLLNEKTFERHELNLFYSLFSCPPAIEGVNFLFPENFPNLALGPKYKEGHPYDLDHVPLIAQEAKSFKEVDDQLKSPSKFLRCSMRMGQQNHCFQRLRTINAPNFNYWGFLNTLPACSLIEERLASSTKSIKSNTVGIHFRHGNGESWWMSGKPHFTNVAQAVDQIVMDAQKFLGDGLSDFSFRIFSDSPAAVKLLKEQLPNAWSPATKLPTEGEGALHFNPAMHPVTSFQESFLDMMTLAHCPRVMYTEHSTFSIPALHNTRKESQYKLFN
jgi:hypothetical protein